MRLLPLLAAVLIAAGAAPSRAADVLLVGVEETAYMPYYEWSDGQYRGFGADILQAFAADSDLKLDFRAMPVTRLFAALVGGDVDLKFPDNPLWSEAIKQGKTVVYSEPVIDFIDGVNVVPANTGKGPAALKTLGTVLGFTAYGWQERIQSGAVKLHENPSLEGLLRQAMAGRVDGAYVNVGVAAYMLDKKLGMPGALVYDPALPHAAGAYHLSTAKRPKVIEAFNAWIKAHPDLVGTLKAKNAIVAQR
jgi:ABC-type amino acid transport substrate-binding protein